TDHCEHLRLHLRARAPEDRPARQSDLYAERPAPRNHAHAVRPEIIAPPRLVACLHPQVCLQRRNYHPGGSMASSILRVATACAVAAGLLTTAPSVLSQTSGTPERFTALAVNMSNVGRPGASTIDIAVNRWSTDAERDRLLNTLLENGPEKL